jgi:hypothetical protein
MKISLDNRKICGMVRGNKKLKMKPKYKTINISNPEAREMLKSKDWEFAGETTYADCFWNSETGELLTQQNENSWEFRELNTEND